MTNLVLIYGVSRGIELIPSFFHCEVQVEIDEQIHKLVLWTVRARSSSRIENITFLHVKDYLQQLVQHVQKIARSNYWWRVAMPTFPSLSNIFFLFS